MTDQPTEPPASKPAIKSVSQWGSMGVLAFWALGLVLKHFGLSPDDVHGAQDAIKSLIDLGYEAAIPVAALVAIWGRQRAKTPISGVLKAKPIPATLPTAEDPPY